MVKQVDIMPDGTPVVTVTSIDGGGSGGGGGTGSPATSTTLGIVRPDNITIVVDEEGVLTAIGGGGDGGGDGSGVPLTRTVTAAAPLTGGGPLTTDITIGIQAATTSQPGAVQLSDETTSTSTTQAATANSVRKVVVALTDNLTSTNTRISTVEGDVSNIKVDVAAAKENINEVEEQVSEITEDVAAALDAIISGGVSPLSSGIPVGFEALWPATTPPDGWFDESLDNGPLLRSTFLALWQFAESSGNILSDAEWLAEKAANGTCGAFSSGDGITTFRVPLLRRVFFRAADPETGLTPGTYQGDAIRNIVASWARSPTAGLAGLSASASGAGTFGETRPQLPATQDGNSRDLVIDASLLVPTAEENRPVTIVRLPIIKAFDLYTTAAAVDIADLAMSVSSLNQHINIIRIFGEIRLLPFRYSELPFGWHFCNGDQYILSTPVGQALNALPANLKTDFGIVVSGGNISIPNMFYVDGRGLFLRAVDGTVRQVGNIEIDQMRPITGRAQTMQGVNGAETTSGAIQVLQEGVGGAGGSGSYVKAISFDSRLLGINYNGIDTHPSNIGMTPAIFLGV